MADVAVVIGRIQIDTVKMESLGEADRKRLEEMAMEAHRLAHGIHGNQEVAISEEEKTLLTMSTLSEEGVMNVKQVCGDPSLSVPALLFPPRCATVQKRGIKTERQKSLAKG